MRTVIAVLRVDPIEAEVQEADIGAGHRRRPTVPVVADVTYLTVLVAAEARDSHNPTHRPLYPTTNRRSLFATGGRPSG